MTQGGQPCKQQNSAQGGPPCAAYLLRRAVRPPNSKMVRRADRPVHHICYTGRSALLSAKWCAGLTALCSTFATQGGPPSYQQNGTQGGPPCASYKLCRAVRPPTSKMFHSQGQDNFPRSGRNKINTWRWLFKAIAKVIYVSILDTWHKTNTVSCMHECIPIWYSTSSRIQYPLI